MRVRLAIACLVSAAIALGLSAPGLSTAASRPASAGAAATKPSGAAMIRIDGDAARAVERGSNLYRVIVPRTARILWLGDADGKTKSGTLGRKGLASGWSRLGHPASGAHALATITWQAPGAARPTYVGALVGNPRANSDGTLTFLAKTAASLPDDLPAFSLNIARAIPKVTAPTVRSGYPLNFPINAASATVGVQASATGDTTVTVNFITLNGGAIAGTCDKPAAKNLSSSSDYVTFAGTCGDITWSGGTLSLFTSSGMPSQLQIAATLVSKGSTTSTFPWNFNMGQWKSGGVQVWP